MSDTEADEPSVEVEEAPAPLDRDEAAFEGAAKTRAERREDKRFTRLLRQRAEIAAERDRLAAEVDALRREGSKQTLTSIESKIAEAKQRMIRAAAEGDAEAQAEAADEMAVLRSDQKARQIEVEHQAAPRKPQLPPEVEEWIDRNPWFKPQSQTKDAKTKLALLAHQEALEVEGFTANSPEYFAHIEKRVENRYPGTVEPLDDDDADEEIETQAPVASPKRQAGPAPVTRRAPGGQRPAPSPMRIKPTQEQIEIATAIGVPLEKYMAQVAREMAAGRIGKGAK